MWFGCFFFQAEDGLRDLVRSRGLGDVYKRQFQAFLFGFRGSTDPLVLFMFPLGGALLALTTALAAACFVKAFGISFLALPRSQAAACLLYTSDAADERSSVDLGGRRIIKKKTTKKKKTRETNTKQSIT